MKEFSIAGITMKNRYVLAPLAGFTDYSLRRMCADYGSSLVYTEMSSCEALYYHSQATIKDVEDTRLDKRDFPETRVALQIFGGKKDIILASIPLFEKYGDYDFLDFNCGCPVPKVVKQNSGSQWLNRPEELIETMKEIVRISSKPVIIKVRIGFNTIIDMPALCKKLQEVGVQAIAVHGRTRKEGFAGEVHYDEIRKIREAVSIPIIANGGIDETNSLEVLEETQAQAIMIGQRAIGYPKVFQDLIAREEGHPLSKMTMASQIEDLKKHLHLIFSIKDEKRASDIMRGISTHYIRGFTNCSQIRSALVHCSTLEEYLQVLANVQFEQ
ncbi:MAG: tRNA-dihydrouridine synthase [Bacilli bacterium]